MKGLSPRNEDEREFIKTFDSLCYGQSRFQVWADFVHMFALSIVNAVDKVHFEEREKRYLRIVKPYKKEQLEGFAQLARTTVLALEKNPFQDFLGELYMRCDLGNEHTGQFFTPYHICELMAQCIIGNEDSTKAHVEKYGYISLCDPCIGGGAMMIGAAQALHSQGINYQQCAVFVGQDIDYTVAMMAYIQLSLLGCPGYIRVGNSLTDPMTGHVLFGDGKDTTFYMPMFFSERFEILRQAAIFRKLLCSVGENEKKSPEQAISVDNQAKSVDEPPKSVDEIAIPAEEPKKEPDGPPIIEISKKKGKALVGQTMFDFGI